MCNFLNSFEGHFVSDVFWSTQIPKDIFMHLIIVGPVFVKSTFFI